MSTTTKTTTESKTTPKNTKPNPTNKKDKNAQNVQADLPPISIFEDGVKGFLLVILIILFLLLFASVVWYFLTQLNTTFVNAPSTSTIISTLFYKTY